MLLTTSLCLLIIQCFLSLPSGALENPLCYQNIKIDSVFNDTDWGSKEGVITLISNKGIHELNTSGNDFRFGRSANWSSIVELPISSVYHILKGQLQNQSKQEMLLKFKNNIKGLVWKLIPENKTLFESKSEIKDTIIERLEITPKLFYDLYYVNFSSDIMKVRKMSDNTIKQYFLVKNNENKVKLEKTTNDWKAINRLNDILITAGFISHGFWYLIADNLICKMRVNADEWSNFCDIQTISQWVGCKATVDETPNLSPGDSGNRTLIMIICIVSVIIISIIICAFVYHKYFGSSADNVKQNRYKTEKQKKSRESDKTSSQSDKTSLDSTKAKQPFNVSEQEVERPTDLKVRTNDTQENDKQLK